eukprot:TRINITY_DN67660_c6_g1_i1.p2 TRINITY_DN67660_c6_g1~~TRINITY_DN67660_c6_g1_i1.p2  ORF type:complete len:315 (-),score=192.36 TRINITY_DN67660_c6_g1_i1:208-1023(-)
MSDEESIYNLIPRPKQVAAKGPLHKSKFSRYNPAAPRKTTGGGMYGPPPGVASNQSPANFLKKHSKDTALPEPKKFTYSDRRKPALPSRKERFASDQNSGGGANDAQQQSGQKTKKGKKKNFVKDNYKAAARVKGKYLPVDPAATNPRHPKALANERKHKHFGQVPKYLSGVKQAIESEKQYVRQMVEEKESEEATQQSKLKLLSEEDRVELLASLKARYAELNKQYQLMTHKVELDTLSNVKRKEELESALTYIEKSIEKLSKQHVFVNQ